MRIEVHPGIPRVIQRYEAHNPLQEEVQGSVATFLELCQDSHLAIFPLSLCIQLLYFAIKFKTYLKLKMGNLLHKER